MELINKRKRKRNIWFPWIFLYNNCTYIDTYIYVLISIIFLSAVDESLRDLCLFDKKQYNSMNISINNALLDYMIHLLLYMYSQSTSGNVTYIFFYLLTTHKG